MFLIAGLEFLIHRNETNNKKQILIKKNDENEINTHLKKVYLDQAKQIYTKCSHYQTENENRNFIYFEARSEGNININIDNAQNLKYFNVQNLDLGTFRESCNNITENIINKLKLFLEESSLNDIKQVYSEKRKESFLSALLNSLDIFNVKKDLNFGNYLDNNPIQRSKLKNSLKNVTKRITNEIVDMKTLTEFKSNFKNNLFLKFPSIDAKKDINIVINSSQDVDLIFNSFDNINLIGKIFNNLSSYNDIRVDTRLHNLSVNKVDQITKKEIEHERVTSFFEPLMYGGLFVFSSLILVIFFPTLNLNGRLKTKLKTAQKVRFEDEILDDQKGITSSSNSADILMKDILFNNNKFD